MGVVSVALYFFIVYVGPCFDLDFPQIGIVFVLGSKVAPGRWFGVVFEQTDYFNCLYNLMIVARRDLCLSGARTGTWVALHIAHGVVACRALFLYSMYWPFSCVGFPT